MDLPPRPRPVRWLRDHPGTADVLLAVVLAIATVAAHLQLPHFHDDRNELADPSVAGVILCLFATLPLIWRRRSPAVVVVVIIAAQWALDLMNAAGPGWVGVLIASYSLGAHRNGRRVLWIAYACIVSGAVFLVAGLVTGHAPWEAVLSTVLSFPASMALGDNMRRRREHLSELSERADRAERERGLIANQQVHDERTRIAREMHDVVAHSVSVMVIQAGAARRQLSVNPQRANEALLAIEATGRQAMDEIRHILGVLRQGADHVDRSPVPSLAGLPDLIAADPDLPVRLEIVGSLDDIPSGVELNAYRVVQEALTNVRRHAGSVHRVAVRLTRRPELLDIDVTDDGRGASTLGLDSSPGEGHGLVGMRERVLAVGGQITAGPRQGGGWRVHATFPVPAVEHAADSTPRPTSGHAAAALVSVTGESVTS